MTDLNVCRICLVHADNEKLLDIYEKGSKLGTEIFLISGIQIMEFTSYDVPALICESCIKDLKIAIKFRNRARSSDKSYFRNFSYDVEELNWNKKLIKLKGDAPEDETPPLKYETVVEEYLESDQEIEESKLDAYEMIIEEVDERETKPLEKGSEKVFKCEYCMQVLSTKKALDYHLKVKHHHNVTTVFQCQVCDKQFPLQVALHRHMVQIHALDPSSFECSECKEIFTSSKKLQVHVEKVHEPEIPGEAQCEACHKIFESYQKMKKHFNRVHQNFSITKSEGESHGPCSVCGKFFKTKGRLTSHEKTHIPISPTDYFFCDLCGNKFKAKSPLLTHIKLRHLAKIRYHCPDCPNRNWATKYALQTHIKVFHHNIRDFRCEWCGKGFGAKDKLTAHIRIHTGEQPFQCQYCGKKYTHQTDFIRHKWSHTGERRYTCQLCKQGYIKKSQLDTHRCPWKQ